MDAVIRLEEAALFVATAAVGYFLARAAKLYIELANRNRVPKRTRVYKSHHFDSTVWDKFNPRDDDVFIVTAYKSGTTWMQQIVAMLIFNGEDPPKPVPDISPWVDLAAGDLDAKMEMIDQLQHRRFLKTHLPATAMPYYPKAKYIYIGRDGRDAYMSLCHHYDKGNDSWYASMNDRPTLIGPPLPKWHEEKFTPATLFDRWISQGWETHPWESDGWPWWSLFYNVSTWWQYRNLENILFVHFNNLKADLPGEMRRIAEFLGTPVDDAKFDEQVRKCTFEYMQGMGDKVAPLGGRPWAADGKADGGGQIFVNKGTNNRWKDVLSKEQLEKYDRVVRDQLTPECATWLSTGEYPDIVVSK